MEWGYAAVAVVFVAGVALAFPLAVGVVVSLGAAFQALDWFTARCPGFRHLRRRHRRWVYRPGRVVSRFVARDVRREVVVVDASRIDEGVITARVRTANLLYAAHGPAPVPPFGEARAVELAHVWEWRGAAWVGPVPGGE